MSAFLAPIHTWVYNKIKIHENLEKNIIEAFKAIYGSEIVSIVEVSNNLYGAPLEDRPIEEVIDLSNIHGWLQGRINIAETRLAGIITEVIKNHGDEAFKIGSKVFHEHGEDLGKSASESLSDDSAPSLYKSLNNHLLEGMPCDIVSTVKINDPDKVVWETSRCLHRQYWESVGGNVENFYKLRSLWIEGFIKGANDSYTYNFKPSHDSSFVHEIVRK